MLEGKFIFSSENRRNDEAEADESLFFQTRSKCLGFLFCFFLISLLISSMLLLLMLMQVCFEINSFSSTSFFAQRVKNGEEFSERERAKQQFEWSL